MSEFVDRAVTVTYRGYGIRVVGDAIVNGVGGKRHIVKKGGQIVTEQARMEDAKEMVDWYIEEEAKRARWRR